jgi:hypothetical protein
MIKEINKDTQNIRKPLLMKYLESEFSNTLYNITCNQNVIMFSHKKSIDDYWASLTLVIKQPVIFLYGEFGNLLMCGMPEDQEDFESNFAKACYKILNELQ